MPRSATRVDAGAASSGRQISDVRRSFPARFRLPWGLAAVDIVEMSAAARVTVVHASAAPKLVEIAPLLRNAETIESASRDAKTVNMVHQVDRSLVRRRRAAARPVYDFSRLAPRVRAYEGD